MSYRDHIRKLTTVYDPRHIEAYMRCEHGTLDRLSPDDFAAEVVTAALCIEQGGREAAEALARSYGM